MEHILEKYEEDYKIDRIMKKGVTAPLVNFYSIRNNIKF